MPKPPKTYTVADHNNAAARWWAVRAAASAARRVGSPEEYERLALRERRLRDVRQGIGRRLREAAEAEARA